MDLKALEGDIYDLKYILQDTFSSTAPSFHV